MNVMTLLKSDLRTIISAVSSPSDKLKNARKKRRRRRRSSSRKRARPEKATRNFELKGKLSAGKSLEFSIDGQDFYIDDFTFIIGEPEIGTLDVVVKGTIDSMSNYRAKLVKVQKSARSCTDSDLTILTPNISYN